MDHGRNRQACRRVKTLSGRGGFMPLRPKTRRGKREISHERTKVLYKQSEISTIL
jgi:hypothetical protein